MAWIWCLINHTHGTDNSIWAESVSISPNPTTKHSLAILQQQRQQRYIQEQPPPWRTTTTTKAAPYDDDNMMYHSSNCRDAWSISHTAWICFYLMQDSDNIIYNNLYEIRSISCLPLLFFLPWHTTHHNYIWLALGLREPHIRRVPHTPQPSHWLAAWAELRPESE